MITLRVTEAAALAIVEQADRFNREESSVLVAHVIHGARNLGAILDESESG